LSEDLSSQTPVSKNSAAVSFAGDFLWISLSQLFVSLLGIFTLPAFTKAYTSEMFGVWNQINVTVALVSPLLTLQLGTTIVRFLSGEEDAAKRRQVLGSMLLAVFLVSFIVLVVTNLFATQVSLFLFQSPDYTLYVRLTFLWVFVFVLYHIFIFYLRSRKQIKFLAVRQIIVSLLNLAVIIFFAGWGFSLTWIILATIAVQSIFILIFLVKVTREIGFPRPNFSGIGKYLSFSLPLIPNGLLMWIISSSDRYFITNYIGLAKTGVYSSSNNLGSLIFLFYYPIGFVLLPVITCAWEQKRFGDVKKYFEYSMRLFLTLAVPGVAGLTILSQPLLRSLTTMEYMVGWPLVLLISIGAVFGGLYTINSIVILLGKQTRWWPLIISVAALVSVLLNITLIPRFGLIGAGISNMVAFFLLAVIVTIWTARVIRYKFDLLYLVKVVVAAVLMAFCLYFIKIDNTPMLFVAVAVGAAVYVFFLFVFGSFSAQDKTYLKQIISGLASKNK
jgi:O-antigen/teichoic acid export membrane protein